ncbi:MAG: immunoglobulin domain-containing protein, partial [Phycisphaerales bacterium]|nr:immunoglobulin domain-containing protein [Phycisphaerales bacterium]
MSSRHSRASVLLPHVIASPTARFVEVGDPAETLTVIVEDAGSYQWKKDGVPVSDGAVYSGATTTSLTIQSVLAAEGIYTCEALNPDGSDLSLPVIFSVRGLPCDGDANSDGMVDFDDLNAVL